MPNCILKLSSNLYVKQRFVVKKLSSEPYSPVVVSTSCLAATYDRWQRWRLHALFYALRAWRARHRFKLISRDIPKLLQTFGLRHSSLDVIGVHRFQIRQNDELHDVRHIADVSFRLGVRVASFLRRAAK